MMRKKADAVFHVRAHAQKVTCLDVGDTGRVLVTGGQDRKVNLWAFGSDKCFMNLIGHNGSVDCVRFTANDDVVFSADDIGIIKQWDLDRNSNQTYNGHMKSVKTLDFIPGHPYFVSGSNDTTIRLWDMTRGNEALLKYSAHIASVNHVQFSPDGNWIASAGAEGTVSIWDVRVKAPVKEFLDSTSAVRCIQFHPSELLLAAGRTNGTVDIFDLDANKLLRRITLSTGTVKCCLFNEAGDWLFVGTDSGVTVVEWEADREVDFVEATWSTLSSLKLVNNKLLCGSLEGPAVQVHSMNVNLVGRVLPVNRMEGNSLKGFLLQQDHQAAQQQLQKQRKESTLRLIGGAGGPQIIANHHIPQQVTTDDDSGSPSSNLSMDLVEEDTMTQSRMNTVVPDDDSDTLEFAYPSNRQFDLLKGQNGTGGQPYDSWSGNMADYEDPQTSLASSSSPSYEEPPSFPAINQKNIELKRGHTVDFDSMNPSHTALDRFERLADNDFDNSMFAHDLGYRSDSGGDTQGMARAEDFPVNSAPPPNYAPKTAPSSAAGGRLLRQKTSMGLTQPSARTGVVRPVVNVAPNAESGRGRLTRKTRLNSLSVSDLTDPNAGGVSKGTSAGGGGGGDRLKMGTGRSRMSATSDLGRPLGNNNKENKNARSSKRQTAGPGDFKVEFFGKAPTRSRSSFDMRTAGLPPKREPGRGMIPVPTARVSRFEGSQVSSEAREVSHIVSGHERVFQQLCNRHATLKMNKDVAIMQDILVAIREVARVDMGSLVDILGAVLEKQNIVTLDMAIVVLPKLYELLQSDRKFHITRACDMLRVILTNFLPIIKDNSSAFAAHNLGVDISSEERWRKCTECRKWLLMIRSIPDNQQTSNALSQLQNLIVDL